ncbi:hypothetical protein KJA15_00990 [Patescibacteria group bacterium]|nr:hypothetical protein [Patescibacteria group bacterium]
MVELIATVVLFGSLIGMGVILTRKIPVLRKLPEIETRGFDLENNFLRLKEKVKTLNPFKNFSTEIFLQKILSKIRILTLKTESKTATWLQKLRERSQKKKMEENDDYWEELKKSTNQEEKLE